MSRVTTYKILIHFNSMPTLKIKNKKITLKQCTEVSELLEEFYISST